MSAHANPPAPATAPTTTPTTTHRLRRMTGRDPHESHRVATSLELLFDLTFVLAFSAASNGFAHLVSEGHVGPAILGFVFSAFAVCWAWVNFTWFASAYDTDDWVFRLTTMLQMIGVLILAMGLPALFASFDEGQHVDNQTMVLGYVVMRVPMLFQWLRAARQDPSRRATAMTYATSIGIAQVGWTVLALLDLSIPVSLGCSLVLVIVELMGPYLAEKKGQTPWHAHHVAERYGLMAIITLGECLVGTIASISAEVDVNGWTLDAALVALAGTLLTFGMWWTYSLLPSAEVLHHHRRKAFPWGYGHIVLFGAIAATGAGLHVAASFIEGHAEITAYAAVLAVVIPAALFAVVLGALYTGLMGASPLHTRVKAATFALFAVVVALAGSGMPLPICLLLLALAPVITITTDELAGARHREDFLARLGTQAKHD
jgi:low temperature requirement protein LtrA